MIKSTWNTKYYPVEVAPYWNVNMPNNGNVTLLVNVEVAPYWNVNY